jgi:hypothetical protein
MLKVAIAKSCSTTYLNALTRWLLHIPLHISSKIAPLGPASPYFHITDLTLTILSSLWQQILNRTSTSWEVAKKIKSRPQRSHLGLHTLYFVKLTAPQYVANTTCLFLPTQVLNRLPGMTTAGQYPPRRHLVSTPIYGQHDIHYKQHMRCAMITRRLGC